MTQQDVDQLENEKFLKKLREESASKEAVAAPADEPVKDETPETVPPTGNVDEQKEPAPADESKA